MTDREREIFQLIESNPLISQSEIASILAITRTSVGVHISNLVKKGYIIGKGYIMAYTQPVTVIGGANVDIQGKPMGKLLMEDSNPGYIKTSLGGVGRNIADNIRMLGLDTRMITAVGDDKEGSLVKENARSLGIDMEASVTTKDFRTSTYLYVLDEQGEMVVAVSDMGIVDTLNPEFFRKLITKIDRSPYTVIDANLPKASIEYLAEHLKETKLILDPVSVAKAIKATDVLDKFYAVKLNKLEAEAILGYPLIDEATIVKAGAELIGQGVERVFITLGVRGVYYHDCEGGFFREAIQTEVLNATGAGDAFTAAMVYGLVENLSRKAMVDFCIAAATVALTNINTIANNMSIETVTNMRNNHQEEII